MRKVFIAIPTLSGILADATKTTLQCFYMEAESHGWEVKECQWQNDSLVAHARNALVGEFLKTDCTDMVWLDSDIGVGPGIFTKLMLHPVEMVGVAYRKKKEAVEYAINYLPKAELWADPATGLLEVLDIPFGLVRLKRSVIEKMRDARPDDWFMVSAAEDFKTWCLFNTELKDNRFWGEDFYFCRLWREIGGSVWVDPEVLIKHVNSRGVSFDGHYGNWLRNRK